MQTGSRPRIGPRITDRERNLTTDHTDNAYNIDDNILLLCRQRVQRSGEAQVTGGQPSPSRSVPSESSVVEVPSESVVRGDDDLLGVPDPPARVAGIVGLDAGL